MLILVTTGELVAQRAARSDNTHNTDQQRDGVRESTFVVNWGYIWTELFVILTFSLLTYLNND